MKDKRLLGQRQLSSSSNTIMIHLITLFWGKPFKYKNQFSSTVGQNIFLQSWCDYCRFLQRFHSQHSMFHIYRLKFSKLKRINAPLLTCFVSSTLHPTFCQHLLEILCQICNGLDFCFLRIPSKLFQKKLWPKFFIKVDSKCQAAIIKEAWRLSDL